MQDIVRITTICALASFDRPLLKETLESAAFKWMMRTDLPSGEIALNFYHSKYSLCFSRLHKLMNEFMVDIYLNEHITSLNDMIRKAAIVQYFTAYSCVSIARMAETFQLAPDDMQTELALLIGGKHIPARIDSQNKSCKRDVEQERKQSFKKAEMVGSEFVRQARRMAIRARLLQLDLVVRAPK